MSNDLNRACINYLQARLNHFEATINRIEYEKDDIERIDLHRRLKHNCVIDELVIYVRNNPYASEALVELAQASDTMEGRKIIGNWAMRKAVELI